MYSHLDFLKISTERINSQKECHQRETLRIGIYKLGNRRKEKRIENIDDFEIRSFVIHH